MNMNDLLDFEPEKWEPEAGDKVSGEVVRITTYDDTFNPGRTYPVVDLLTDAETQTGVRLYGSRTVLRNELTRLVLREGDQLGIKYHGKATGKVRDYERYTIVHRPAAAASALVRSSRPPTAPGDLREVLAGELIAAEHGGGSLGAITAHLRERAMVGAAGGDGGSLGDVADDDDGYVPPDGPLGHDR